MCPFSFMIIAKKVVAGKLETEHKKCCITIISMLSFVYRIPLLYGGMYE